MNEVTFDTSTLGNGARRLLEVLRERADEDGRAQLSTVALLDGTGLTQGALVRARNELTAAHLLRVEKGYTASGRRGANVYVLNSSALGLPDSEAHLEDESGQNETAEPVAAPVPAVHVVPDAFGERKPEHISIWARLFRRSRAS